jgi:MoxR-like ATPase
MSVNELASLPWDEVKDIEAFRSPRWTSRLIGDEAPRDGAGQQEGLAGLLDKYCEHPLGRLRELERQLDRQFVCKEHIIRMVIVCSIAQQPMLLVGRPGTAKSKIVLRFCEGLGLTKANAEGGRRHVFQYLLHAFTENDELAGPVIVDKLRGEKPAFERFRDGSITDAEVIFLDEVFRANSAILNTLLSVINERQIYEGGRTHPARARLIFGASNGTPTARQLEDLRAFYERFIVRIESESVPLKYNEHDGGVPPDRRRLLEEGWKSEVNDLRAGYRPEGAAMTPVACLNDVLFLNRCMTELWGGSNLGGQREFIDLYHQAVARVAGGRSPVCEIDDRKFIRLMAVIRAHALYMHNGPPRREDLTVMRYIWHDVNGRRALEEAVNALCGQI